MKYQRLANMMSNDSQKHYERSTLYSTSSSQKTLETQTKPPRPLKVVECKICNIRFSQMGKLRKHYNKSPKHPVCAPCDVGFEDEAAYHAVSISFALPSSLFRLGGIARYEDTPAVISPSSNTCPK